MTLLTVYIAASEIIWFSVGDALCAVCYITVFKIITFQTLTLLFFLLIVLV